MRSHKCKAANMQSKTEMQPYMEWLIANHRIFELLDETGGYTLHLIAMTRVGVIGLTAGSVVEQESSLRNSLTASSAYFQRLRSLLDVFSISLFSV